MAVMIMAAEIMAAVAIMIENYLLSNCQEGDLLITMGAGDVVNIGEHLLGK